MINIDFIFIGIIALAPILWFVSLLLLRNWNHIIAYVAINCLIYLSYIYFFLIYAPEFSAFNLSALALLAVAVIFHVVAGFLVALIVRRRILKNDDQ